MKQNNFKQSEFEEYEEFLEFKRMKQRQVALLTNQLELANERERRLMALIEHQTGADKSVGLFSRLFK